MKLYDSTGLRPAGESFNAYGPLRAAAAELTEQHPIVAIVREKHVGE